MLRWVERLFGESIREESTPFRANDSQRWEKLAEILDFIPKDRTHYERALRHRSIIDDDLYDKHETYERLEFLGDAVLDLIVTEIIFDTFPLRDEGFLTQLRAKLVKGDTLAELARKLELYAILEVGERAHGQGIELSKSVLADLFESLTAAIYLTEGYRQAYRFIDRVIDTHLDLSRISTRVDNYKSELLEYTQAEKLPLPSYRVRSESGPGHDKTFEVVVHIGEREYGIGEGKSKKDAEQLAAKTAWEKIVRDSEKEN